MPLSEKCVLCGQPIDFENYVGYTPYGQSRKEFECLKCWDDQGERGREFAYIAAWIKPVVVRNSKSQPYIPRAKET